MYTFKVMTDNNEIVEVKANNRVDAKLEAAKVTNKHWSQILYIL